jgi:hypothetical protein
MTNRYLTIVFATLIFALAFVAMMTSPDRRMRTV